MKKICLIHPEGNINNNPNLSGIVEILCGNGYRVDIYSTYRPEIYQKPPCQGSKLILENRSNILDYEKIIRYKYSQNYHLVIGVDIGIIEAGILSRLHSIPYGYISYEIFFSDEIGFENKKLEIEACRNISFAIVQDEVRAQHLNIENKIHPDKFFYIPVAGRGIRKSKKKNYWHEKFNIPNDKKIALYMGTIHKWAMSDDLIENAKTIPEDWHIVIHNRYGFNLIGSKYRKLIEGIPNYHLSTEVFDSFDSMNDALSSADLGLAFYNPIKGAKYEGKNIQYIGLASGKISTYLQHGIPIATNKIHPIIGYIDKFNIGIWFENIQDLGSMLDSFVNDLSENCFSFFNEYLNLDNTIEKFLHFLKSIENTKIKQISNDNIELLTTEILYLNQEYINPLSNQLKSLKKQNERLMNENFWFKNSLSYKILNEIVKPISFLKHIFRKL
jgi:hypothetical protein